MHKLSTHHLKNDFLKISLELANIKWLNDKSYSKGKKDS